MTKLQQIALMILLIALGIYVGITLATLTAPSVGAQTISPRATFTPLPEVTPAPTYAPAYPAPVIEQPQATPTAQPQKQKVNKKRVSKLQRVQR